MGLQGNINSESPGVLGLNMISNIYFNIVTAFTIIAVQSRYL